MMQRLLSCQPTLICDSMTGMYVTPYEDTQQAGAMLFMCLSCMHAHFHSCINADDC